MSDADTLTIDTEGDVLIVSLNRPEVRNAVDSATARAIAKAFIDFDNDDRHAVAVFAGSHGTFCAGADLKAVSAGNFDELKSIEKPLDRHAGHAPMGPSYLRLRKPVIGAISGYAVAGGLELSGVGHDSFWTYQLRT